MLRTSLKLLRNLLGLLLLIVATAYGQGSPPSGQRPQEPPTPSMEIARLTKVMADASVPLSDEQQTSILMVYEDGEIAARSDAGCTHDEATRHEQMRALMASVRKAVRGQLSDEQAKVFDTMRHPTAGSSPSPDAAGESGLTASP